MDSAFGKRVRGSPFLCPFVGTSPRIANSNARSWKPSPNRKNGHKKTDFVPWVFENASHFAETSAGFQDRTQENRFMASLLETGLRFGNRTLVIENRHKKAVLRVTCRERGLVRGNAR